MTLKEELLNFVTLRKVTCEFDIKNALDEALANVHVPLNKLVRIVIDGAPAMIVNIMDHLD